MTDTMPSVDDDHGNAPTLSEFIARYERQILEEWERIVRTFPIANSLDRPALMNHIPDLLRRIRDLAEHLDGLDTTEPPPEISEDIAEHHALERLEEGFDLSQVVGEFSALRDAVARLWENVHRDPVEIYDARILNHAIDKAVAESVTRYTRARDKALLGLDRIANEALESRNLDDMLRRLLAVLLETTPALDTAAIYLHEKDALVVRAVAGPVDASVVGSHWPVDTGVAGRVASAAKPAARADDRAPGDAQALEDARLRAVYAVPLVDGGSALGVVQVGSFTANDLSRQDKRLVAALASRATAALYQHMLREQSQRALAVVDALLEASSVGVAFLDTELRYVRVNDALATLNGTPASEHIGRRASDVIGEPGRSLDSLLRGVLETRTPVQNLEIEAPRLVGTGEPHTFLANFFPVITDGGEALGVGAVIVEITDRKRAERELQASEERLNAIVQNAPLAIYMKDQAGRYILSNKIAATFAENQEPHDALSKTPADVLRQQRVARMVAQDAQVVSEGVVVESEEHVLVGGEERVVLSVKFPVPGRAGERLVCGVAKDITDRKRVEDEQTFLLRASEVLASSLDPDETLRALARLAVTSICDLCVIDRIDEERGPARVAVELRDPALASTAAALTEKYPPDGNAATGIGEVLRSGTSIFVDRIDKETPSRSARSKEHLAILMDLGLTAYMAVPIHAHGRRFGAMSVAWAGSGRRYTPQDLALLEELGRRAGIAFENGRLYKELERAVELRDQILAIVSHDLKNPLATIDLALPMVERAVDSANAKKQLAAARRASTRMSSLIGDLLDMAALRAGRFALELKPESVDDLLRDAIEQNAAAAAEKGLSLTFDAVSASVLVRCDRERIEQVLANLIGNAIKFTRQGGVHVAATVEGETVVVSVRDTGPGISKSALPHVFDAYWSAEPKKKTGTGLGLFIAKGIIEAHGGTIWVRSTSPRGTEFVFSLPLAAA